MEIIIGKEGDQAFPIKSASVSRKHAKLTITDDNEWILEDLNSKNGTYIQDENGDYIQIKHLKISEFTRIALGSTTATGFFFFAHHVLETDDSYGMEMRHVLECNAKLNKEKEDLERADSRQTKIVTILPAMITAILTTVTILIWREYYMYIVPVGSMITLLSLLFKMFQQKNTKAMKELKEKQGRLIRCPRCNRALSPSEIVNEQCVACKVHS